MPIRLLRRLRLWFVGHAELIRRYELATELLDAAERMKDAVIDDANAQYEMMQAELTAARATIATLEAQVARLESEVQMKDTALAEWGERSTKDLATARAEAEGLAVLLADSQKALQHMLHEFVELPPMAHREQEWAVENARRVLSATPTEAAKRAEAMRTALAYYADPYHWQGPILLGTITGNMPYELAQAALSGAQEEA